MEFKLNGTTINYEGDPELSLMTYLRDVEEIISPKDGCAPEGVCGCCSVLLDGNVLKACIAPMRRIAGKEVITMEGLDQGKKRNCGQCFCHRRRAAVRILHTGNHHESLALVESGICDRERNQQGPEQ